MKMIHTNINKHMIYTGTHINITFLTTINKDYTPLKKLDNSIFYSFFSIPNIDYIIYSYIFPIPKKAVYSHTTFP